MKWLKPKWYLVVLQQNPKYHLKTRNQWLIEWHHQLAPKELRDKSITNCSRALLKGKYSPKRHRIHTVGLLHGDLWMCWKHLFAAFHLGSTNEEY